MKKRNTGWRRLVIAALTAASAAGWAADPMEPAFRAYMRKDYEVALKVSWKLSKENNLDAHQLLGMLHLDGLGGGAPRDYRKAVFFFTLAAEQGQLFP